LQGAVLPHPTAHGWPLVLENPALMNIFGPATGSEVEIGDSGVIVMENFLARNRTKEI